MPEWKWRNFAPKELLSPDGLILRSRGVDVLDHRAVDKLDRFREHLARPILVNHAGHLRRGWRSPRENNDLNGWRYSFHMAGKAFDLSVNGMEPREVAKEAIRFGWPCVIVYSTWVHVDSRDLLDGTQLVRIKEK